MSPEGAEWRTPTRTIPDASTDNINESEKGEKSFLCMGNPSCKAEEFFSAWASDGEQGI